MPEFDLDSVRRHPAHVGSIREETRVEEAQHLRAVEVDEVRGWLENVKGEMDSYYTMGKAWATAEPDVVMIQISSIIARLTEIRAMCMRDNGQRTTRLRLNEIDPLIEALNFQFKIHSRLQAIREMDYKVSGAQV